MSVSLFKAFLTGMTDYIARHNANYGLIESNLNYLLGMVTGQAGGDFSVPPGLKEIFDRQGLIGIGSYDFNEGTLSGPNYYLAVTAGAYWSGNTGNFKSAAAASNISMAGKSTDTYYLYLDESGSPAVSTTPQTDTIRQFDWNESTHVVSNKALYTGVAILFDGDDYADCLTSAARSKDFEKLADRLEEIEQLLAEMSGFYAEDPDNHVGLDFYCFGGKVRNDSAFYDTPDGHVTLADDSTNYVEVNPADGSVSANTTGFTSGQIGLFVVATASGAITTVTDKRTWALAGTGGGGGGHTQNTDLGTSSPSFILNMDKTGAPTENCQLEVERGDEANVAVRWNETTKKWEYTNDGVSWADLGAVDVDLGAQEFTKYVPVDDPEEVWTETSRGSSVDWEDLDLSSYISAMQGCAAVVLRVFFWDSAPGAGVNTQFRKKDAAAVPALAYSAWEGEHDPKTIIVGVNDDLLCQLFVNASGVDTANLRVFLLGYFEKVIGVGTQKKTFQQAVQVDASTTSIFNLTGFVKRGIAFSLQVEETGGNVVGTYDIGVYAKDTCGGAAAPVVTDADKLYIAKGIVPSENGRVYEDFLGGWRLEDEDGGDELHMKIANNDPTYQGAYTITIVCEQFA